MKKRNITFGYKIENGRLTVHPAESQIVLEVFEGYASGQSLKQIADSLTERQIEFFPGKHNWDKARVKRILENSRYLGEDGHPQIIERELFEKAEQRKSQTSPSPLSIDLDIKELKPLLHCGCCGRKLNLRVDRRLAVPEAWRCPSCRKYIRVSHEELRDKLFRLQQAMMEDPIPALAEEESGIVPIEARRIAHELRRQLDSGNASESELITLALRCAAETYSSITSAKHISDRLTAVLQSAGPLSSFDRSLFIRTVKSIRLHEDGSITLELKDGRLLKG